MASVDRVVDWAAGHLPASYAAWLVVPALFVILYLASATLLRQVAPLLVSQLVVPVVVLAVGAVGIGVLTLEFVSAQPFRLFRRRPPTLLYTMGDLTVGTVTLVQRQVRGLGYQTRRLRWLRAWAPLLAAAALLALWNHGWCARHPDDVTCLPPLTTWQSTVSLWWRELTG
ncbi:hypothetical protein [Asanoa iriomotensis]|uniref:Uncharacterized protein n=1 Tax=Asanoa iriomotensis TaxID=234613 RepID=A0ABQ4CFM7_9ACTN|nr:hypothetical protein [Asanoa iriomotensis]GIF61575.1 hypothetical protein Air01nite_76700 [Asanoa iriomotensis]